MVTFINMVMTRVKNGSPDMILTAFDKNFTRKKMSYLPGAVDLQKRDPQKSEKTKNYVDKEGVYIAIYIY